MPHGPDDPNPLLLEDSFNSRLFLLGAPRSGKLDHDQLAESFEGTSLDFQQSNGINDKDDLVVLEPFRGDSGDPENLAVIEEVDSFRSAYASGITGLVKQHEPDTVSFKNKRYLVLDDVENRFMIFESGEKYYLAIFGNRGRISSLSDILSEQLRNFGFAVKDLYITSDGFEDINNHLVDALRLSTISGYTNPNIDMKRIYGYNYDGDHEFERELRDGSVSGHRFGSKSVTADEEVTIEIANDGLVRCYNKIALSDYIDMIAEHIVPNVQTQTQTSVHAFSGKESMWSANQD